MEKANFLVTPTNDLLSGDLTLCDGRLPDDIALLPFPFPPFESSVNEQAYPICQFSHETSHRNHYPDLQSVFSALSQGLEYDILENSIGLHGQ